MVNLDHPARQVAQHVVLVPQGLRVEASREMELWDGEVLVWDRIELEARSPASTRQCLWDFLGLAHANETEFLDFIQRWGLLDAGDESACVEKDGTVITGFSPFPGGSGLRRF